MIKIVQNYQRICENIANLAKKSQRNPEDITLVAVTKGRKIQDVATLQGAGCQHFGESRLQEALLKQNELSLENGRDIHWHFIGSLQKNKVQKAIPHFFLLHGIDSYELALKISERGAGIDEVPSILLQVNTSQEMSKHGFSEKSLLECFEKLQALKFIKIEGLMTMAPFGGSESVIRQCFCSLRLLQEKLNGQLSREKKLKTLSMGMSQDYEFAIEEGATMVRIGTALFD